MPLATRPEPQRQKNPFARSLINDHSIHHACFPFPAPTVQGRPPRRGKWGGVPSQLMFCLRHDQAPNQKHGIEDTPRDCTRDASYIFGLWLKNWSFFRQSSNTQDCVRSRILSGFPAPPVPPPLSETAFRGSTLQTYTRARSAHPDPSGLRSVDGTHRRW